MQSLVFKFVFIIIIIIIIIRESNHLTCAYILTLCIPSNISLNLFIYLLTHLFD